MCVAARISYAFFLLSFYGELTLTVYGELALVVRAWRHRHFLFTN